MVKFFSFLWNIRFWLKFFTVLTLLGLGLSYISPFVHPKTQYFVPFFGLAYPIFLIVTVFFLILWIILRSSWAWIVLGVIVLGGNLHFRTFTFGKNEEISTSNYLHVMSYNVRLFDVYNPKLSEAIKTRNKIFNYIQDVNPDVICFQEFYQKDKPTDFKTMDTIMSFMKFKDYHQRSAHKNYSKQNFGIYLFSKYPIYRRGDVIFDSQSEKDFNYCIYADIIKNRDTFRVYNAHLQSIKLQGDYYTKKDPLNDMTSKSTISLILEKLQIAYPKRAEQAKIIMKHIENSPYPVIVCGDFNDTPLSFTYEQFNSKLTDAFRNCGSGIGSTYVGRIPAGRIDYIFHSDDLNSAQFRIQEKALSDHRAVSCKVFKKK
jgi:endonuclease/exonuclease/phosphatase family metal-dependent hydrolase